MPHDLQGAGIRIVLLDAVGTVIVPRRPIAETYQAAGDEFGSRRAIDVVHKRLSEALRRYTGASILPNCGGHPAERPPWLRANTSEIREYRRWRRIVAHVFDDIPSNMNPLFQRLWNYYAEAGHWTVQSEFLEVRRNLQRRGLRVGLASNFDRRLVTLCERFEALQDLDYVFCSSEIGVSKPDPRFYRAIERRTGFGGKQILLVGDDPLHDVRAPDHLGWRTLLWDPNQDVKSSAPNRLNDLRDLWLLAL